jgi:DNA-binding NarL/FixJ family response regulator
MKILILEDRLEVINKFLENIPKEHEVVYTKTSTDAIWNLAETTFDIVFLDHDVPDTHQHNGLEVAMFLAIRFLNLHAHRDHSIFMSTKPKVIIHSRNKFGSQAMAQILPNAICWPGIQEFPEELKKFLT